MNRALCRQGLLSGLRTRFNSVVCLVTLALALQLSLPMVSALAQSGPSNDIAICSNGFFHASSAKETPVKGPTTPLTMMDGKCCTAACHIQGVLTAETIVTTSLMVWTVCHALAELVLPRQASLAHGFEARAPPVA